MLDVHDLNAHAGEFSLDSVSFHVHSGDYFVILGPSGCGKSVLLSTLSGLHPHDSGRATIGEESILERPIQARQMALVPQDRALFPHLSVRQNVAYGLKARGYSKSTIARSVETLATRVGIEGLLDRRPGTLSGGEAQRVALARALAVEPPVLLLDEPLSALDGTARSTLRTLLRSLHRDGQTIVHVTHDYQEAISLATRVAIMETGKVVQVDTPEEVFRHPQSRFVAQFVGIKNFFRGELHYEQTSGSGLAEFRFGALEFSLLSDEAAGSGALIIRSEDINLSESQPAGTARNCFRGTVVDLIPAPLGVEVMVDMGVEMAALVSVESAERIPLKVGKEIWLSIKASAVRYIPD